MMSTEEVKLLLERMESENRLIKIKLGPENTKRVQKYKK